MGRAALPAALTPTQDWSGAGPVCPAEIAPSHQGR